MTETALYTVIHPAAVNYVSAWCTSVVGQSDKRFDLWISLDNMTREEAVAAMGQDPGAEWLQALPGDTPAAIRLNAISRLVESYKHIVFVDCDDVLHPLRVRAAIEMLQRNDVIACPLVIIDEAGNNLGIVFGGDAAADAQNMLPRHNVFGLSNSAYRTDVLKQCLPFRNDCVLIDWLLATRAWSLNAALAFDTVPRMFYRQYRQNTARVLPPFSEQDVLRASERVVQHYEHALSQDWPISSPYRERIEAGSIAASTFHASVTRSPDVLSRYVSALNELPPRYVWWWSVANPHLEKIWKQ